MLSWIFGICVAVGIVYSWVSHFRQSAIGKPDSIELEITRRFETILLKEVGIYRFLPIDLKKRLQKRTQRFLSTIEIQSGHGLPELSERMKIGIAGQASLLLLSEKRENFCGVRNVVVYPGFIDYEKMAGHSCPTGQVTIAIQSSRHGGRTHHDGYNLVLHEFAHQLDFEEPFFRGIPRTNSIRSFVRWVIRISREKKRFTKGESTELFQALQAHPNSEDPSELFAFAVEFFFERPHPLKREHPELYGLLEEFLGINPARLLPQV